MHSKKRFHAVRDYFIFLNNIYVPICKGIYGAWLTGKVHQISKIMLDSIYIE